METKSNKLLSVIIPTFNRAHYLKESIESLVDQTLDKDKYEVIIIDDGSTDNTQQLCKKFHKEINLRYFYQNNSGISTAKNLGILVAQSPILLFFDDDDIADKNLLKEHLNTHNQYPNEEIAVLGYTEWDRRLNISHLMHYITDVGQLLFSYKNISDGEILDYTFFWGGRSSCKRSFLIKYGIFNQTFRFGCEDIELGYRLSKYGLKVVFNKKAKSYMIRPITFDDFKRRIERQGRSQFYFSLLHKDKPVQEWTQVIYAEEKWKSIKDKLENFYNNFLEVDKQISEAEKVKSLVNNLELSKNLTKEQRIQYENLKSFLDSEQFKKEFENGITALHTFYWWLFYAYKIKGIIEEKSSYFSLKVKKVKITSNFNIKSNKKNILVIDLFLPYFDRASGSLRAFHILKSLIDLGYNVTFLSKYDNYYDYYVPILQQLGIETYAGDTKAIEKISKIFITQDFDFIRIIKETFFEKVIIAFWDNAEYYLPLIRKHSPNSKIIVDSVDIVFLRKIREAEILNDRKLLEEAQLNKLREIKIYNEADALWVITEKDLEAVKDHISKKLKVSIVTNIHQEINFEKKFENTRDLLFIGNFWHNPNVDAINYFVTEIFPIVEKQIKDVKLNIIGDNVPKELMRFSNEKIKFLGYVKDTAPYLMDARISIAPLRFGAGMKGKVGEALSWGLPVITTSIGAEGMNLTHNENVLIADDPISFANEIIRLYNDKNLWNKLSKNSKEIVEKNWSPRKVLLDIKHSLMKLNDYQISIVLVTYNGFEYTQKCLESIDRSVKLNYQIIIVDNNSQDLTKSWLQNYSRTKNNVKIILNEMNHGFPYAINQGIREADGDNILILNNDTILTNGLVERLLEVIQSDEKIGIVGPISNEVSGLQKDPNAKYEKIEDMFKYAEEVKEKNKNQILYFPRVAFLCTLIKK
ncbi:MAG: glycosyltransferase, partial [Ignavibacterium sp.]|nr:glycosyltransferase [Ignavibacterium sp.]